MKESFRTVIKYLLLYLVIVIVVPYFASSVSLEFRTLAVMALAIVLWTVQLMPLGISSLFIIGMLLSLDVVGNASEAFGGFVATSAYFLLAISMLGNVFIESGH